MTIEMKFKKFKISGNHISVDCDDETFQALMRDLGSGGEDKQPQKKGD